MDLIDIFTPNFNFFDKYIDLISNRSKIQLHDLNIRYLAMVLLQEIWIKLTMFYFDFDKEEAHYFLMDFKLTRLLKNYIKKH